jgi:D-amino-acid dehydrogenase
LERVVVVGAGAVGLCAAESLSARGVEVAVIEGGRCGAGASAGNAGWITPSLAVPVPGPGVIGESLRWLVNPSGPLWIRPTLSAAMLAWVARFIVHCRASAYRRGLGVLQQAAAAGGRAFERLAEREVEFERHDEALLYPAFEEAELAHLLGVTRDLEAAGIESAPERVSAAELLELEPALDHRTVGGVIARGELRVRPESFVAGLRRVVAARGCEVREEEPVLGLRRDGRKWLIETPSAARSAEAVILACGVAAAGLLEPLGLRFPIASAKGYSRTYARNGTGPRMPLYLEKPKVAISVFDDGVRVSGTLELGARSLKLSSRRLPAIAAAAQQALPGWHMPEPPSDWAGMRSLTPDGLPYVGPVPGLPGLHLATGHATLGITLAPLTGELLADLLVEHTRDGLLAAFDPARAIMNLKATTGEAR